MNTTPTDEAILKTDVLGRVRTPSERREQLLDEFERTHTVCRASVATFVFASQAIAFYTVLALLQAGFHVVGFKVN
jgi:hypothetical protein